MKATYFQAIGGRNWVFCGERRGKGEPPQPVRLFYASRVAIKRPPKIKGAANPFDPAWEVYFEQRLGVKIAGDLKGRRQLLYLWREQGGRCPSCYQPLTTLTGWHSHHIVWRVHRGSDRAENRVLLPPHCQRQVHSQDLSVVKPRSPPSVGKA